MMSGPSPRSKKRRRTRDYLRTSKSFDEIEPLKSGQEESKATTAVDNVYDSDGLNTNEDGLGTGLLEETHSSNDEIKIGDSDDDSSFYTDSSDDETSDSMSDIEEEDTGDDEETEERRDVTSDLKGKGKRVRRKVLSEWLSHREEFLNEILRLEAPINVSAECPFCGNTEKGDSMETGEGDGRSESANEYIAVRCEECDNFTPRCAKCVVDSHQHNPLHRLKYFTGGYWEKTTLREIGLVLQLNHDGKDCPEPADPTDITVIDINGIQVVSVSFCGCLKSYKSDSKERIQLLRHGYYPATVQRPRTVATHRVLKLFHLLTLQGKTSAYDFYQTLVRITDPVANQYHIERYVEFVRMVREFRHLLMLKRSGKALEGSVVSTSQGELGLACPACPHPGVNIPADWESARDKWLYTQFMMVDANFRLKSKANKSKDDPALGPGWSYFVEDTAYKEHLKKHVEEKEIRYCDSGLRAVDHANLKGSQVYEASGVVGVQCRHMLVMRNGVGDLQKGEKFGNVDYVLLSAMKKVKVKRIVLSYDINCQYHRNFSKRMEKYPDDLKIDLRTLDFVPVIPKFHLPGHGEDCQSRYSLNYCPNVGRTDGENIERGWAQLNPVSMSTKEMGKGSRQDTLDDHIQFFNWERITAYGRLMKKNLEGAIKEESRQRDAHAELSTAFSEETLLKIREKITDWENNAGKEKIDDPFRDIKSTTTLKEVQELLAEQDRHDSETINDNPEELTPSQWLTIGIELEENQHNLRDIYESLRGSRNRAQKTQAAEKNALMFLRLKAWIEAQRRFMPGLPITVLGDPDMTADDISGLIPKAYDIQLRLPSSLDKETRDLVCLPGLEEKEIRLRKAQADDYLQDIRRIIRKGFTLANKKNQHVRGSGQGVSTRMNTIIKKLTDKREWIQRRYEKSRAALEALDPGGDWSNRYKVISPDDIEPPEMIGRGTGQGTHIPAWIWRMEGAAQAKRSTGSKSAGDDGDVDAEEIAIDEGMCVEWARSYARLKRWQEEIVLLKEEMKRVIIYFLWLSNEWISQAEGIRGIAGEHNKGKIAHANRQATLLRKMAANNMKSWQEFIDFSKVDSVDCLPLISIELVM